MIFPNTSGATGGMPMAFERCASLVLAVLGGQSLFNVVKFGLAAMDRRHWMLLVMAVACLIGLGGWIMELDVGLTESLNPPPAQSR